MRASEMVISELGLFMQYGKKWTGGAGGCWGVLIHAYPSYGQ